MTRSLNHHLNPLGPGPLCQLSKKDRLHDLGPICRIHQTARPQTIAKAQRDIMLLRNCKDPVIMFIKRVLLIIVNHPFHEKGPATAHNAQKPRPSF